MFGEKNQPCLNSWRRKSACVSYHHDDSQEIPYSQNKCRETSHAIYPFPIRVNCELCFFVHFIFSFSSNVTYSRSLVFNFGGLPGSTRLIETKGIPTSRTFFSNPNNAAWSTTGPVNSISPSSSSMMVRPSNQF